MVVSVIRGLFKKTSSHICLFFLYYITGSFLDSTSKLFFKNLICLFISMCHPISNADSTLRVLQLKDFYFLLFFYLISTDESKKQIKSLVSCTSNTGQTPFLFLFLCSSGLIMMKPFIPK